MVWLASNSKKANGFCWWGRAGVTETELMPRLLVGYTELGGGKLKKDMGFWEPNFGVRPNLVAVTGAPL